VYGVENSLTMMLLILKYNQILLDSCVQVGKAKIYDQINVLETGSPNDGHLNPGNFLLYPKYYYLIRMVSVFLYPNYSFCLPIHFILVTTLI